METAMKVLCIALCIFAGACKNEDDKTIIPTPTSAEELNLEITEATKERDTPHEINNPSDADPLEGFVQYTIPQGQQNCLQNGIKAVNNDSLVFDVLFDSTAIYTTQSASNQGDINKLFGFSDCSSFHHTNSARFGWRYYKGHLELFAYTYAKGTRNFQSMGVININQKYTCTIVAQKGEYVFYLNHQKPTVMERGCNGGLQFRLFPYFGGDELAPHEVKIWIKERSFLIS